MTRRTSVVSVVLLLALLALLLARVGGPDAPAADARDVDRPPDGPVSTVSPGVGPATVPSGPTPSPARSAELTLAIAAGERLADALGEHLTACDLSALTFGGRPNTAATSPFERSIDGVLLRIAPDASGSQVVFDTNSGVPAGVLVWEPGPDGRPRCRTEPLATTTYAYAPADGAWVRFDGPGCTTFGVWTLPDVSERHLGVAQVGRCDAIAVRGTEEAIVDLRDPPLDDQGRVRWDFGPPAPFEGGGVVFGDGTAVAPFDVALDASDLPADVRAVLESWRVEAEARDAFDRQTEALWADDPRAP